MYGTRCDGDSLRRFLGGHGRSSREGLILQVNLPETSGWLSRTCLAFCPSPCRSQSRQKEGSSRRMVGGQRRLTGWDPAHQCLRAFYEALFPEPPLVQNASRWLLAASLQNSDPPLPKWTDPEVGPSQMCMGPACFKRLPPPQYHSPTP